MIKSRLLLPLLLLLLPLAASAKTFKIATISPDGVSWIKKVRAGMKEVDQRTGGRVKFKLYPGGVQGDDQTVLRKVRVGQLHGGAVAAGSLSKFYPDLNVYSLPLKFRDYGEVDYIRERMDAGIIEGLAESGVVTDGLIEAGFAYIMSMKPITSVGDAQAAKVWVPDDDELAIKMLKTFDITPIPLDLTDVIAGLQTGLIDAVVGPPLVAITLQWHTQVKYVTRLPIMYIYTAIFLDRKAFARATPADRAVVSDVMAAVYREISADNREASDAAFEALLGQGVQPVTPSPDEEAVWRRKADASIQSVLTAGELSSAVYDRMEQLLAAFRRQGVDAPSGLQ